MKTLTISTSSSRSNKLTHNLFTIQNISIALAIIGILTAFLNNKLILTIALLLFPVPFYIVIKYCKEVYSLVCNLENMFDGLEDVMTDLGMD